MVDNFNLIIDMLQFDSTDDFYFMQLIQRRKENPEMTKNSRAIKTYIIKSKDMLEEFKPDIITFCEHFNARATIRLNRRSFKQCSLESLRELARNIADEDFRPVDKIGLQVMGKYHSDPVNKWLLDVDGIQYDDPRVGEIIEFVENIEQGSTGKRVLATIPSRTGCHLIVTGFNPNSFKKEYPEIELIKDSPTNIYIP